jgi:hypothetical protein
MGSDRPPEGEPFEPIKYTSDVFPTERADSGYPPTGRAHPTKHGAAGRRRPRYHPRPKPRRRADLMGFNAMLWLVLVIALVVVLVLSY